MMELHKPMEKIILRKRELLVVAGRIMALKDVRALFSRICKCVTLHGDRDFANVIKLGALT